MLTNVEDNLSKRVDDELEIIGVKNKKPWLDSLVMYRSSSFF